MNNLDVKKEKSSWIRYERHLPQGFSVDSTWLGEIDITTGYEVQRNYLLDPNPNEIKVLGCEHSEVLSLGKSTWDADVSLWQNSFKQIHKTNRGGKLTFHNEGQLIIYPMLHLKTQGLTLKDYVKFLLEVSAQTLNSLGLNTSAEFQENIGLYGDSKKLVSIGLNYSRGWVSHGLSINVNNDLEKFRLFDVCGHSQMEVTSVQKLGVKASTQEVFELWIENFKLSLK